MPNRDVVVIGASAGGIEALQQLCSQLPADLDASVLIVMQKSPHSNGFFLLEVSVPEPRIAEVQASEGPAA